MLVRVYRTDKFAYTVDAVDAKVEFSDASLTKEKKTVKTRTTPGTDDLSIYTLMNDTISVNRGTEPAFLVLKRLSVGVYEIVFRAEYVLFPMAVNVASDTLYWISESLGNFYYFNGLGHGIVVHNITGDRRDFNTTSSTWTVLDISPHLRNNSVPAGVIGRIIPLVNDLANVVWITYGEAATSGCDDGSSLFHYNSTNLRYIGDQPSNLGYWLDAANKWWAYADTNTVTVTNYETNTTVFSATFTDAQLQRIINRYSLGSWLGPLVAIGALWIIITLFCAVFCRDRC